MKPHRFTAAAMLLCAVALAGCGEDTIAPAREPVDPAVLAALGDQILVDPDLARQNEGSAALTGGIDHALPLPNRSLRAIDAARAEALAIVGGRDKLLALPAPAGTSEAPPLVARLSVVSRARHAGAPQRCVAALTHDFGWAARMPAAFPIYPHGATQEAAGAESGGCSLRAIHFRTPVAAEEVLAFYHTLAQGADYASTLATAGDERVLRAAKGDAALAVFARQTPSGITAIDLVTWGG